MDIKPSWDSYFMGFACVAARNQSTDEPTDYKDGSCIVKEKVVVGIGRRQTTRLLRGNKKVPKRLKDVHSVADAILKKNVASLEGCTLYTTIFPCNKCTHLIIQSKIGKVKYLTTAKYRDSEEMTHEAATYSASCWMLKSAKIECKRFEHEAKLTKKQKAQFKTKEDRKKAMEPKIVLKKIVPSSDSN